jgi:N-acetylglucosaminyldiphosphoundecaprenol N-acetyl-beta-D-mannosaminyltransferase
MRIDVMGVEFDNVTMDEAIDRAAALLASPGASYAVTPNAEIVYEAMRDESLCTLLNGADLVLPDGSGIVLGAKLLKTPLKQKVAGIDFADHLLGYLAEHNLPLYLLGSKPGIAERAAEAMVQKHPGLLICGTADGYFQDEQPVVQAINAAKPAALFVCLGAPKQERFMVTHQAELDVRFMIGLGGSLDGFAGTVKRAPVWMQRAGLEWLYRLIQEPSRFRRMLRLPKFVLAVIGRRIKGGA